MAGVESAYEHPYDGVPKSAWRRRAEQLHEHFPIPDDALTAAIAEELTRAIAPFHANEILGGRPLAVDMFSGPFKSYVHDWIAQRLGEFEGFRYGHEKAGEKDVICLVFAGDSLELKTVRGGRSIIGNRSAAKRREPGRKRTKAQDSWYVAVSWDPGNPETGARLNRISVGYLSPEDFHTASKNSSGEKAGGQMSDVPFNYAKLVDVYISDEEERHLRSSGKPSVKRRIARRRRAERERATVTAP